MKDIVVIIPLHKFEDEETKRLLKRAIESVPSDIDIRIATVYGLMPKVAEFCSFRKNITVTENINPSDNTNMCSLVNREVETINTDWFSILEYDDTYNAILFDNFHKYKLTHEANLYMSITDLVDYNKEKNNEVSFVGFTNEAPWATSFSNELGYIDKECLENYFNFNLSGSIFNTQTFKASGKLKSSIKLSYWYEFMLRFCNLGNKVYVIPKVGYTHYIGRADSTTSTLSKSMTDKEVKWWIDLAKEEYFYQKDRNIQYSEEIEDSAE